MSDKDRTAICDIISNMLDNPDEYGIYPTTVCYTQLEQYVESVRAESENERNTKDTQPKDDSDEH